MLLKQLDSSVVSAAITEQTDKCFLNLTAALSKLRPAALVGPNNVGKRQTIKQLAQVD
jgi:hypothetical protein